MFSISQKDVEALSCPVICRRCIPRSPVGARDHGELQAIYPLSFPNPHTPLTRSHLWVSRSDRREQLMAGAMIAAWCCESHVTVSLPSLLWWRVLETRLLLALIFVGRRTMADCRYLNLGVGAGANSQSHLNVCIHVGEFVVLPQTRDPGAPGGCYVLSEPENLTEGPSRRTTTTGFYSQRQIKKEKRQPAFSILT